MFAGLTKKNVERGKWRYLSEKEVRLLKFMNAGGTKKSKKIAQTDAEADNQEVDQVAASRAKPRTKAAEPSASRAATKSKTVNAPVKKAKRTRTLTNKEVNGDKQRNKAADGGRDRDQAGPIRKQASKATAGLAKEHAKSPTSKPQGRTTRKEKN